MKTWTQKGLLSSGKHTDRIYYDQTGDDKECFAAAIKATQTNPKQRYKRETVRSLATGHLVTNEAEASRKTNPVCYAEPTPGTAPGRSPVLWGRLCTCPAPGPAGPRARWRTRCLWRMWASAHGQNLLGRKRKRTRFKALQHLCSEGRLLRSIQESQAQ